MVLGILKTSKIFRGLTFLAREVPWSLTPECLSTTGDSSDEERDLLLDAEGQQQ